MSFKNIKLSFIAASTSMLILLALNWYSISLHELFNVLLIIAKFVAVYYVVKAIYEVIKEG